DFRLSIFSLAVAGDPCAHDSRFRVPANILLPLLTRRIRKDRKSEPRIHAHRGREAEKMMKVSFQARFTKSCLVSHFMPIPVKYEMSACFKAVPPMKSTDRTMKRDGHKQVLSFHIKRGSFQAVSRFVSHRMLAHSVTDNG